jgi:sugar phosphate isomerase/epimerase
MRWIASGLATPAASVEDDCRIAARLPADGLELALAKLPPALERHGLAALAARLRREARPFSLAAVEDVTFRDRAGTEAVAEAVHRAAEVARAVGATWVVVTPGERPNGCDEREASREAQATLGRLARLTERYDIGLALCPLGRPWASVRTVRQALAVLHGVGRRSLGLAPDTFEAWAAGSRPDDLKACDPRALAMLRVAGAAPHVAPEDARDHHRRAPGEGPVPVADWLAVALAVEPALAVTAPVAPIDRAVGPEDWVRRLRETTWSLARPDATRAAGR